MEQKFPKPAGPPREGVRERTLCRKCDTPLNHFSGLEHIPEYLYCPECNDTAYDENLNVIARLA